MKKSVNKFTSRLLAEEAGQVLILVLVFFLLASLTVLPTLAHMSTALKTGVTYEKKTNELFSADAGVENGLWRIKYDDLGPTYNIYDYSTVWSYQTDPVNNQSANVTIQNIWLPTNVSPLSPDQMQNLVQAGKLDISGTAGAVPGQPYHIKIDFTPATGDNLTITSIGIWLPQGFKYTVGSSDLEQTNIFNPCHPDSVSVTNVPGGQAVVWSYNPVYPDFTTFPNFVSVNGTMTSTFTFTYSPPAASPNQLPLAVAWVTTAGVSDSPLAWDIDARFYKVTSATGKTQIEAYSSKSQLRNLGGAIAGDYVSIGNSLMTGGTWPDYIKTTLLSSSSTNVSTVSPIPNDADVISAILYWSGFRHDTTVWTDTCSNFNNWTKDTNDGSQTEVPTGDGGVSGTWNPTPASPATCWDKVDETTANDTDYMTGTTAGGGYKLFTFSPFTIANQPITNLTIYFRAKRTSSSGSSDIRADIKVNGSYYQGSSNNPSSSGFTTYSYSFTTNPNTGAAWTAADINGTGPHSLQQFGVYSNDLSPTVEVSMVYAQVNYTSDSLWTIYNSSQFQGTGSSNATTAQRTLTMNPSLVNLSSYPAGTIAVSWTQTTSGNLGSSDALYFAFSGDGGNTWSSNIPAFQGSNPTSPFYYIVPTQYMTANFAMRFYFNFTSSSKYVRLDNITVYSLPPDTSVTFAINGQQVYLDGNGNPQAGSQPVNATSSSVYVDTAGTSSPGFSYACHLDVSKMVQTYPVVPGEQHHTGNANYTVGGVSADPNEYVSYAGWSLIIIYSCPETAGHYLYLNDVFDFDPGYTDLDFDNDGQPGGDITGFVLPEPIRDKYGNITETVAASITCFVGEGDAGYTGDSLMITGQQSGNSEYLSNSASPWNNVWNSASPGCSYPGIDVDPFQVLWTDNILTPGDTRLHLDLNTQQDAFNLIYIVLSIRSQVVTSGTVNYLIHGLQ